MISGFDFWYARPNFRSMCQKMAQDRSELTTCLRKRKDKKHVSTLQPFLAVYVHFVVYMYVYNVYQMRCTNKVPFTRRQCEDDTKSLRIVSDAIVFGRNDTRVFTRRRCSAIRDVQRSLRLVRRRSGASTVARQRLQNVIGRGLGHCAPQTHRDRYSTGASKCIAERAAACSFSPQ